MLAIEIHAHGGLDALTTVDRPTPSPGPGQILVRHKAVGLNYIDVYHRSGLYPVALPAVLGQEAAGVVEAVGADVTRFKIGDRAAYVGVFGAYAEANAVPADRAVRLPDAISFETAAAVLLKGLTAEFLLRRCYPVRQGQWMLVHAAAGGVGGLLTQWGRALGARVIGTAGSEAKADIARAQGCEAVAVYGREPLAERVKAITDGQGVSVVYDGVGAETLEASLASLARRGMLVSFGNASGPAPAVEPGRLARGGSLYLTRPTLWDYVVAAEDLDAGAAALFGVIGSGAVKVAIGQRFALRDAARAHEALQGRQTTGATVFDALKLEAQD